MLQGVSVVSFAPAYMYMMYSVLHWIRLHFLKVPWTNWTCTKLCSAVGFEPMPTEPVVAQKALLIIRPQRNHCYFSITSGLMSVRSAFIE